MGCWFFQRILVCNKTVGGRLLFLSEGELITGAGRAINRLNSDMLMATAHVAAWPERLDVCERDPERVAFWFQVKLKDKCDLAMPKTGNVTHNMSTHWPRIWKKNGKNVIST